MVKQPPSPTLFRPELLPNWQAALSDAALRDEAGAAVFARGQTYAASGAVQEAELAYLEQGARIALRATVMGTQPYGCDVLVDEDDEVTGDCDCPHAQDGNFCKHQVALALTLRGLLGGDAPAPDPQAKKKVAAAAKRAQTQAGNRDALKTFVQGQSAAVLAERLWAWAETDRDFMAELKAWAAQSRAGSDGKALASAITELLRKPGDFLDWRESGAYAYRAEKVLPMLEPLLARDPAQLRELCEHALRRLYKVAEHADDSNGEIGGVMQGLMDLLLRALQAEPPPGAWLERWFALMADDPWGLWNERAVLDAAGPAVQARYAERAAKDWLAWLGQHPTDGAPIDKTGVDRHSRAASVSGSRWDYERHRLRKRYLDCLRQQDDPQAVIDAMRAHLEGASEHSELVAYCESLGKHREALQFAQAARKLFPKDWRSEADLLRCYERDGWDAEALVLRRAQLERAPDVEHYRAVLDAAERAGRDRQAYRDELFAWAQAQEMKTQPASRAWRTSTTNTKAATERVVSVRVRWLLSEHQLDEPLALAQAPNRCHPDVLLALARKLPSERHVDAVPLLLRVFEVEMAGASSPYQKPLSLVQETLERMAPVQRCEWLAYLRAQYKAKRNFIKELPTS